jgi:hypothetical protein
VAKACFDDHSAPRRWPPREPHKLALRMGKKLKGAAASSSKAAASGGDKGKAEEASSAAPRKVGREEGPGV